MTAPYSFAHMVGPSGRCRKKSHTGENCDLSPKQWAAWVERLEEEAARKDERIRELERELREITSEGGRPRRS